MDRRLRFFITGTVVLLASMVVGCTAAGPTVSASQYPNWPQTRDRTAEETRAIREAEIAMYMDPRYGGRPIPARKPHAVPSADVPATGSSGSPQGEAGSESTAWSQHGGLLFVSGQLPIDPQGIPLPPDSDVEAQARAALENVRSVLHAHGLTMTNVVSMNVFLRSLEDLSAFEAAAADYLEGVAPARSVVQVARLPNDAAVEVSVVAGR